MKRRIFENCCRAVGRVLWARTSTHTSARTRTRPGGGGRPTAALTVLVLVLVLLPLAACSRPHLHDFLPPPATPSAVVIADPGQADLLSISMVSPSDGWAVGAQGTIMHYDGATWKPVSNPATTDLMGISMTSSHDGWAVGASYYVGTQQRGTILHYSNGRWAMVDSPTTSYLDGVDMLSPTQGWAVGKDILQYVGGHWTKAENPDGGLLSRSGVAMLSADTGWAVSSQGFIMQCTQGVWTDWSTPDPTRKLYAISMAAPDDGWAVGEAYSSDGIVPLHALLLHYSDSRWTVVPAPATQFLYAISMVSPTEGWAVGANGIILHDIGGQWQVAATPTHLTLHAIAMLSSSEGWAVGVQGTILHFSHGRWTLYHGG